VDCIDWRRGFEFDLLCSFDFSFFIFDLVEGRRDDCYALVRLLHCINNSLLEDYQGYIYQL